MTRNMETPSSCSIQQPPPNEQGAGGKLRRQPTRRPPASPYARSSQPQPQTQRGRWLSKLVDPACRLIASGATRVFPSFFSKLSEDSLSAKTELRDELGASGGENAGNDARTCTANLGVPESADVSGVNRSGNRIRNGSLFDGQVQVRMSNITAADGVSEIEKLMKGKTFSSDEIRRLTEILKSRAADNESKDFIMMENGARGPTSSCQSPGKLVDIKQQDMGKVPQGPSTPLSQSTMENKIGASPVDIAKAYMAKQKSEISPRSVIFKDEKPSSLSDDLASQLFLPSPSPRPSTCWPGAIVHDQQGYVTPQGQKGRIGLHNFSRTPYSRTISSGSKPRLSVVQGDSRAIPNCSSIPFKQSQIPMYGQLNSSTVDNRKGSVGPIRRIRHGVAVGNSSVGFVHGHSLFNGAFKGENNDYFGSFPSPKQNLELGGSSGSSIFHTREGIPRRSDNRIPIVHPHSSQMAKTILEHLERNLPTPKAKSAELKMVTSWQDRGLSNVNTAVGALPTEPNCPPYFEEIDFSKQMDGLPKQIFRQSNGEPSSLPLSIPSESTKQVMDNANGTSSTLLIKADATLPIYDHKAGSSVHFGKPQDSQITMKNQEVSKIISTGGSPPQSSGNRPILPSISVSKRDQKVMFTADSSTGFTFPVSAYNGVSSEPPTPSIMPSLSGSGLQQQKEEATIPSYEFGTKRSSPVLVFSFPSTSSVHNHVSDSGITFNFGSDGSSSRISFSSISKDAICY